MTPPHDPTTTPEPATTPPIMVGSLFMQRVQLATYGIILFVLSIHLLKEFREMLQPFFVALFLGFLMQPIHRWFVCHGIPSLFAYGVILALVLLGFFVFGSIMYINVAELARDEKKLRQYEDRLDPIVRNLAAQWPFEKKTEAELIEKKGDLDSKEKKAGPSEPFWRGFLSPTNLIAPALAAFGGLRDSTSWAALVFLFIVFLIAEKVSFPKRLGLAFGPAQGVHVMSVVESISQAIGQYIAVKTFISALAGLLSYAVLAFFGVELAASWGILIFMLNYIPYVGSLIACALPIILSFLQFDELWKPFAVTLSLIGIQQIIGNWVEPRMAGQRLDVSPLLIVLSLAFWWSVWGIFGAILAVPLLVIVKIILDNIPETKPIATLISNR